MISSPESVLVRSKGRLEHHKLCWASISEIQCRSGFLGCQCDQSLKDFGNFFASQTFLGMDLRGRLTVNRPSVKGANAGSIPAPAASKGREQHLTEGAQRPDRDLNSMEFSVILSL